MKIKSVKHRKTQCELIESWLSKGKSITPIGAIKKWGITRLAARCYDLKQAGAPMAVKKVRQGYGYYTRYYFD